ncbi:Rv3235 family protein [Streptomyces sp. NPDC059785]|uniref:Rv3235 family protein n=1 Tax=Streptomyces sp. NPDC059785 TaxID=3346945 RepID=UPI0036690CED
MLRHTAGRAYDDLAWLAEHAPLGTLDPHGTLGTLRTRTTRTTRPTVREVGYYVAGPGALEVFARISTGDRLHAMAFRLEQATDLRWRCTAIELGTRRPCTP